MSEVQITSLLEADDVQAAIANVVQELATEDPTLDQAATTTAIQEQIDAIAAAQALQKTADDAYAAAARQGQDETVRGLLDEQLERSDR